MHSEPHSGRDEETAASVRKLASVLNGLVGGERVKTVLDVGSRDGFAAMELSRQFPSASVYAFECNPPAIELVKKNIAGAERVELVDRAVSDKSGPISFFSIDPEKTRTVHTDGNIGASSLFRASPAYPHESYAQIELTVQAIRLDEWAKGAHTDRIDVIWMDLQGAAMLALRGLGTMLNSVSAIYTELEYKEMYLGQPMAKEVRRFLSRGGFSLYAKYNQSEWFGDELFVRSDLISWKQKLLTRLRHPRW